MTIKRSPCSDEKDQDKEKLDHQSVREEMLKTPEKTCQSPHNYTKSNSDVTKDSQLVIVTNTSRNINEEVYDEKRCIGVRETTVLSGFDNHLHKRSKSYSTSMNTRQMDCENFNRNNSTQGHHRNSVAEMDDETGRVRNKKDDDKKTKENSSIPMLHSTSKDPAMQCGDNTIARSMKYADFGVEDGDSSAPLQESDEAQKNEIFKTDTYYSSSSQMDNQACIEPTHGSPQQQHQERAGFQCVSNGNDGTNSYISSSSSSYTHYGFNGRQQLHYQQHHNPYYPGHNPYHGNGYHSHYPAYNHHSHHPWNGGPSLGPTVSHWSHQPGPQPPLQQQHHHHIQGTTAVYPPSLPHPGYFGQSCATQSYHPPPTNQYGHHGGQYLQKNLTTTVAPEDECNKERVNSSVASNIKDEQCENKCKKENLSVFNSGDGEAKESKMNNNKNSSGNISMTSSLSAWTSHPSQASSQYPQHHHQNHPNHPHPYGNPWLPRPPTGYNQTTSHPQNHHLHYSNVQSSGSYGGHGVPTPHGHPPYAGFNAVPGHLPSHPYDVLQQQHQSAQPVHSLAPSSHHEILWSNSSASTSTAEVAKPLNGKGKNKNNEYSTNTSLSSTSDMLKKRVREEPKESREDISTMFESSHELRQNFSEDTASSLSIAVLSMSSIGKSIYEEDKKISSPKRRKGHSRNQNIHRFLSMKNKEGRELLLENSSTLSDGKMIFQNLSINSLDGLHHTYSAEIAELCAPSPINTSKKIKILGDVDEGRTPKKRNTSSNKHSNDTASLVFRLDSMNTPAAMSHNSQNDDSPSMIDLIGGAETPTTGLLLSSMDNVITDESCLDKHLRGQSFTPLPHIMGTDDALLLTGNFAITPQLSWNFNNSPLESSGEKMTPRFGLDSTKSKNNPLSSPKSFWNDDFLEDNPTKRTSSSEKSKNDMSKILSMLSPTVRDMDINETSVGGETSNPIPLRGKTERRENTKLLHANSSVSTPHQSAQVQSSQISQQLSQTNNGSSWGINQRRQTYMHSPIPTHQSYHQAVMSPYERTYPDDRQDGPQNYGMYPATHQSITYYNRDDRIRNLRGRGPPIHHMPSQHHLPPPSYHHFSPLTKTAPRGRGWHQNQIPHHLDLSSSKRKCIPVKPPIPSKFQGDIEKYKDAQVPEFNNLVNFPGHINQKQDAKVPEGMRCCVMCGQACPCSQGGKQKKNETTQKLSGPGSSTAPLGNNNQVLSSKNCGYNASSTGSGFAIIPTQNKGLCTLCDVNVWIVAQSGLEIKWCKGCKNFRPWAAFGDKGLATKCVRCRDRQREKYALKKEEKEKVQSVPTNVMPMTMDTCECHL